MNQIRHKIKSAGYLDGKFVIILDDDSLLDDIIEMRVNAQRGDFATLNVIFSLCQKSENGTVKIITKIPE